MTRETKIGLLVGLAFIIVIGILLSEHVSSTNEPQQASLYTAGSNVRDGVVTPGGADDGPPVTIAGAPVQAPRQPVPTNVDLHPPSPPVAYVPPAGRGRANHDRGQAVNGNPSTTLAGTDGDFGPQHRDGVDPHDRGASAPSTGSRETPRTAAPSGPNRQARATDRPGSTASTGMEQAPAVPPTTYVAVAGDSVSRIAARLMGGNTKANRELLISANPPLQNQGNVMKIGQTYVIPNAISDARADSAQTAGHGPPAPDASARPAESTRWYTVKGDDNLWRIAESQLGTGTAWTQIRDLNKDVLKGGETVHPNMRLRLPSKTAVAGAE